MSPRMTAAAAAAAALMVLVAISPASAGKGGDNRAPAPTKAAQTTSSKRPFADVANQNKAPVGVKLEKCNTRSCWHHHTH